MRRTISAFLLALLVVFAQQAALVHEIGHGFGHDSVTSAASASDPSSQDSGAPDKSNYCEKCFQFAHVTSAATAFAPNLFFSTPSSESASGDPAIEIAADAPALRSRGPPIIL